LIGKGGVEKDSGTILSGKLRGEIKKYKTVG